MSHPMEGYLRDHYQAAEVRAITKHLIAHGTFRFPTLSSGLFLAAPADREALRTLATNTFGCGTTSTSRTTTRRDVMSRPHIRFDGEKLAEVSERWAHAQNDAIGYWLWLASQLALSRHWQPTWEDIELLATFVEYLAAIRFWQDEDSGHWEEARKVEASSIGAATAGLTALGRYFRTLASQSLPGAAKSVVERTCRLVDRRFVLVRRLQEAARPAPPQTEHLNRSLRQLTAEDGFFPPLRCPESYYRENGAWGPNDVTPLLWTQANLRLALHFQERSVLGNTSSRIPNP